MKRCKMSVISGASSLLFPRFLLIPPFIFQSLYFNINLMLTFLSIIIALLIWFLVGLITYSIAVIRSITIPDTTSMLFSTLFGCVTIIVYWAERNETMPSERKYRRSEIVNMLESLKISVRNYYKKTEPGQRLAPHEYINWWCGKNFN